MGSTEIGRSSIRRSKAVTCARVMRLRRSATSKAFATSKGHMAGVIASVPAESKSRTPSVNGTCSSSKHQATATDASRTIRLITAPRSDQLADRDLSKSRIFSKLANFSNNLMRVCFLARIGGNQFRNRNPSSCDSDRLALGNSFQKAIQMGLCVEDSNCSLMGHAY